MPSWQKTEFFIPMNLYTYFYCRAFKWYNTNGKKDPDTLRISAVSLVSAFQMFNVLSVFFLIGLIQKHTPINKWGTGAIAIFFLVYNFIRFSVEKSDNFKKQFEILSERQDTRLNIILKIYMLTTLIGLLVIVVLTAYIKNKFGNYDDWETSKLLAYFPVKISFVYFSYQQIACRFLDFTSSRKYKTTARHRIPGKSG